jgi:hypothetical protein
LASQKTSEAKRRLIPVVEVPRREDTYKTSTRGSDQPLQLDERDNRRTFKRPASPLAPSTSKAPKRVKMKPEVIEVRALGYVVSSC